jgi:D-ornithine 4,5-aminomutase subunit alpha
MPMKREDDYQVRREHLKHLTEDELRERFFSLAEKVADPLIELSMNNTTPSIERSVLLRMGFSSLEAKDIVNHVLDTGLMGKGAGNVVLKVAEKLQRGYLEVGREMTQGSHFDTALQIFKGGAAR